jgi:hypothetical protein
MPTSGPQEELLEVAHRLGNLSAKATAAEVKEPLERLEEAATSLGKAWNGSYLGYYARIYYKDLRAPPPGPISVLSGVIALKQAPAPCDRLAQPAPKADSPLARQLRRSRRSWEIGTSLSGMGGL